MTDLRVALEVDLAVAPGQTENAAAVWACAQAALPAATLSAKAPTADGRWPLRIEASDPTTFAKQMMQLGPVLAGLGQHSTVQAVRLFGPLGDDVHAGMARTTPNVAHVGMYRAA